MNLKETRCEAVKEIALVNDKFQHKGFVKTMLNRRV
jgi:hypothetical protein